jgi:hypothetical protein
VLIISTDLYVDGHYKQSNQAWSASYSLLISVLPYVLIFSFTLWDVSYMANANSMLSLPVVALLFDYCSSFGILNVSCLDSIHSDFRFDYFQCQFSISLHCSTERGGMRARLTACVQGSISIVSFVSFRYQFYDASD